MTRLFSGFQVSEEAEEWLSGLQLDMPGARWINPADFHVTLRFFGEIDGPVLSDIHAALSAARQVGFMARVTGLSCFGGERPRALVASVDGGEALMDLHRVHERAALSAGLAPERRKYTPHVTVARLDGTRPETVARFIQSFTKRLPPDFWVGEAVLFSSRVGGGGPYIAEETFSLARGISGTAASRVK